MLLPFYQVDAFSAQALAGNPAAVCPLESWVSDSLMQAIAGENNLAETAFFVPNERGFDLRWFTPTTEVDLCGHATLASAHVLFEHLGYEQEMIRFFTRSGELQVQREGAFYRMDFPALPHQLIPAFPQLEAVIGQPVGSVAEGMDYLVELADEAAVQAFIPNMPAIAQLGRRGLIITAKGNEADFVSRFFAPQVGVPEDPVTGSAHCMLTPFWAAKLGKTSFYARQLSPRGGELWTAFGGDRVELKGQAVTVIQGNLYL
jgi:predicted PhzF superfamily epimerase YddE/YHI9